MKLKQERIRKRLLKTGSTGVNLPLHQNKYIKGISTITAILNEISIFLKKSITVNGKIAEMGSWLSSCKSFNPTILIKQSEQPNWLCLPSSQSTNEVITNYACVKQGSQHWHDIRQHYRVTGSTLHNALGLRSLKEQKAHFDKVMHGIVPQYSTAVQERLKYGSEKEEDAIATLTCKL